MKKYSALVQRCVGVLLALFLLAASQSSDAWPTRNKKSPGIAYVHEDGGRLDLVRDPELDEPINFLGQKIGHYKYLIVRKPGNRAYIAAYHNGEHLFSVPDEEIDDIASDWNPVDANNGYDFYMSPDRRYLFVNRYLISHLDVALLYKQSGRRWTAAGSERFDDAALHAYCRARHLDPDNIAGPSRRVRLVRWDLRRRTLVFRMAAASFWFNDETKRGDMAADWMASCRLRDMRFRIISDKIYRFTKPGSFPLDW